MTSIVQQGLNPTPSALSPHYNQPLGHWPCVKSCLVGGRDKYTLSSSIFPVITAQIVSSVQQLSSLADNWCLLSTRKHHIWFPLQTLYQIIANMVIIIVIKTHLIQSDPSIVTNALISAIGMFILEKDFAVASLGVNGQTKATAKFNLPLEHPHLPHLNLPFPFLSLQKTRKASWRCNLWLPTIQICCKNWWCLFKLHCWYRCIYYNFANKILRFMFEPYCHTFFFCRQSAYILSWWSTSWN